MQFNRLGRNVFFDYISPHCDLAPDDIKPLSLHNTQAYIAIIMHHHMEFDKERFSSSKDIIQTDIHQDVSPIHQYDLELEHSNHPFHKTLELMVLSNKILVAKTSS